MLTGGSLGESLVLLILFWQLCLSGFTPNVFPKGVQAWNTWNTWISCANLHSLLAWKTGNSCCPFYWAASCNLFCQVENRTKASKHEDTVRDRVERGVPAVFSVVPWVFRITLGSPHELEGLAMPLSISRRTEGHPWSDPTFPVVKSACFNVASCQTMMKSEKKRG